jgi:gliding motility-associated-like protein
LNIHLHYLNFSPKYFFKFFFLIFLLSFPFNGNNLFGQNQTNYWYFGDHAGLNFSAGKVTALTDGAQYAIEGCATISDSSGNLLFYTDGIYVYNKKHRTMPNGTGLHGHQSTTQSALIVPVPLNDSLFYIFTLDAQGGTNGFEYSIVNMKLDTGLGDIISKNNLLFTPATEKVTAIKHSNGVDFWVVAHDVASDTFLVYKVDKNGLSASIIKTKIGEVQSTNSGTIGYMKFSPDGKKLGVTNSNVKAIELFDFDASTGKISNPLKLSNSTYFSGPYGLEFSPDGTKLYASTFNYPRSLCQMDITSNNASTIMNSLQLIYSSPHKIWGLQVAIDGKIYASMQSDSLGVINNPNIAGSSCNFTPNGIYLKGKSAFLGLPNFIQSYFFTDSLQIKGFCYTDSTNFNLTDTSHTDSIYIDFGDKSSHKQLKNLINFKHKYLVSNNYKVVCYIFHDHIIDTIIKRIHIAAQIMTALKDTIICTKKSVDLNTFLSRNKFSFLWQDGSKDSFFTALKQGKYWVNITDSSGCSLRDTILVKSKTIPKINLGNDSSYCNQIDWLLKLNSKQWKFLWSDGSKDTFYHFTQAGQYWLNVSNQCGNMTDTLLITKWPSPMVNLGKDTFLCPKQTLVLNISNPNCKYVWNDGFKDSFYYISKFGKYWVTATNKFGCQASDTINIDSKQIILSNKLKDTFYCNTKSIDVDVTNKGATYLWNDGSTSPKRTLDVAGKYIIQIKNECNTSKDSFLLSEYFPPSKRSHKTQSICNGDSTTLIAIGDSCTFKWSNGSLGPNLTVKNSGKYFLTKSNACGTVKEEYLVTKSQKPYIKLGGDTSICLGTSISLGGKSMIDYVYFWQDSSTKSNLLVNQEGLYYVNVTNNCGSASDSIFIKTIDCNCNIYIPNAFTPNRDGLNDYFLPSACTPIDYNLKIYTRWGELIFESHDISKGWNGYYSNYLCEEGVYIYLIQLSSQAESNKVYKGFVNLLY